MAGPICICWYFNYYNTLIIWTCVINVVQLSSGRKIGETLYLHIDIYTVCLYVKKMILAVNCDIHNAALRHYTKNYIQKIDKHPRKRMRIPTKWHLSGEMWTAQAETHVERKEGIHIEMCYYLKGGIYFADVCKLIRGSC